MKMLLERGTKYQADLSLGFFERLASNDTIVEKLEEAGFTEVHVWGSNSIRHAQGTWGGPTQEVELPSQIANAWAMHNG